MRQQGDPDRAWKDENAGPRFARGEFKNGETLERRFAPEAFGKNEAPERRFVPAVRVDDEAPEWGASDSREGRQNARWQHAPDMRQPAKKKRRLRGSPALFAGCAGLAVSSGVEFALRWEGMYRVTRIWLRTVFGAGISFSDAVKYMGDDAVAYLAPAFALACALFGLIAMPFALFRAKHPVTAVFSLILMLIGLIPGRLLWTGFLEPVRYVLLAWILLFSLCSLRRKRK